MCHQTSPTSKGKERDIKLNKCAFSPVKNGLITVFVVEQLCVHILTDGDCEQKRLFR